MEKNINPINIESGRLPRKNKKIHNKNFKTNIFILCTLAFPIAHFLVFYVGINANSIMLAFQKYNPDNGNYIFFGVENFVTFFKDLVTEPLMLTNFKNSITLYFVGLLLGTPLTILISYCVFKKIPFEGVFRVILFMPSIISGIVFVLIFKYFVDYGVPVIWSALGFENSPQFLSDPKLAFGTIIFYGLWTGFGTGVILYSNAMTRIPDSLLEYGQLEGLKPVKEMWHVVIPMIFPTITTFLVTGVTGIFIGSGAVFSFFRDEAPAYLSTFGYFLFVKVIGSHASLADYPYAAAAGLVFTVVAAPLTFIVKWALEKFGPSAEY